MSFLFDHEPKTIARPLLFQSCELCGLYRECATPKMSPSGPLAASLYIVGEAPGVDEDREGEPFVGSIGRTLRATLSHVGQDDQACRFGYAVSCYQSDNSPTERVLSYCADRLDADLSGVNPCVVIALGNTALNALGYEQRIDFMRGRAIADPRGFWVVPTFCPKDVVQKDRPDIYSIFRADLLMGVQLARNNSRPVLYDDWDENNHLLTTIAHVHEALDGLWDMPQFSFDFETRELRPFSVDAELLTVAFSVDGSYGIAFPVSERYWGPREAKEVKEHLVNLLADSSATKIAHKMQFEMEWVEAFLGGQVGGNYECTMLMGYALDERIGGHNLDFMSQIFLARAKVKALDRHKSQMHLVPLDKLLSYGCHDARQCVRLHDVLRVELEQQSGPWAAYREIICPAVRATVRSQIAGSLVDQVVLDELSEDLGGKLVEAENTTRTNMEIQEYEKSSGRKFRLTDDEVRAYLFTHKRYVGDKKTPGGKKLSVDQEVLEKLAVAGDSFCRDYLAWKKLAKLKSTYVDNLRPLIYPDGRFHTNFNIARTRTGRLSGSEPNLQNFPTRAMSFIRRMIVAPEGYLLASYDFKQIEAIVWGLISGDKKFLDAVVGGYDIHGEKAARLWGEEYRETRRQRAKNKFVFPSFFGAMHWSIARDCELDPEFVKHLQDELWLEFPDIRRRQFAVNEFYHQHLYVETMTGRRRHGPLSYTEILNTPIQGTASDLAMDGMIRLTDLGYRIVITVHDDLVFELERDRFWEQHREIVDVLCHSRYDWVTIPLKVDTKVGLNWSDMVPLESGAAGELVL